MKSFGPASIAASIVDVVVASREAILLNFLALVITVLAPIAKLSEVVTPATTAPEPPVSDKFVPVIIPQTTLGEPVNPCALVARVAVVAVPVKFPVTSPATPPLASI